MNCYLLETLLLDAIWKECAEMKDYERAYTRTNEHHYSLTFNNLSVFTVITAVIS